MLLCAETPHAIVLSNVMKSILERATKQFEKNLAEGMIVDLGPFTVTYHGHFFGDMAKDATWDSYITYPYILWDPITQYQCIEKNIHFIVLYAQMMVVCLIPFFVLVNGLMAD